MQTISRNNIRHIVVTLVKGCEVEISAQKASKRKRYQAKKHFISFGCKSSVSAKKYIPMYYSTSKGNTLSINTLYDTAYRIYTPTSYFFKIIIPEGCQLKFNYVPQPLGFSA